jgi:hypothetical protein
MNTNIALKSLSLLFLLTVAVLFAVSWHGKQLPVFILYETGQNAHTQARESKGLHLSRKLPSFKKYENDLHLLALHPAIEIQLKKLEHCTVEVTLETSAKRQTCLIEKPVKTPHGVEISAQFTQFSISDLLNAEPTVSVKFVGRDLASTALLSLPRKTTEESTTTGVTQTHEINLTLTAGANQRTPFYQAMILLAFLIIEIILFANVACGRKDTANFQLEAKQ